MKDNKYLAWTAFALFFLSVGLILLFILLSPLFGDAIENPASFTIAIGAFSLIGSIFGFLTFKAPQAKVGAIGNLLIVLLVLFVIPVGSETSMTPPLLEVTDQEHPTHTGIDELDTIIDTVLEGSPTDVFQLLQFSSLACTHADGLGGPPKCREAEVEGTIVEVLPILGPEGHHMRRSDMETWEGIQATGVYAAYRVSPQAYSDKAYPAGEYAVVFDGENESLYVTLQITDGKIVRVDYLFGGAPKIELGKVASEFLLAPEK